jgi:hypothetical protein
MDKRSEKIPHPKRYIKSRKHMERFPMSFIMRKILIKSIITYHCIPLRIVQMQKPSNRIAGNSLECYKLSFIAGENTNCSEHFVKHFDSFL